MPVATAPIYVVQHTSGEFLGLIEDQLEGRGLRFTYFRPFTTGGGLPASMDFAKALILLGGGPWGTHGDRALPNLKEELALTWACLARGKPVIGIGLGAQILAIAAGGGTEPGELAFEVVTARRTDDDVLDGNRVAVSTGLMAALGAQVIDYSTWYDCCGFGFRHIISEREFTRSFAIDRKIRVAVEEARADVMIGHDTGCITTLDKNQWISKATGNGVELPILADCQFAALVCGAHPYKIVQSHWHASPTERLMEQLGIDWQAKKTEFEAYLKEVEAGNQENLYDPRRMITSGPGFKPHSGGS